jgi:hypothetical protein
LRFRLRATGASQCRDPHSREQIKIELSQSPGHSFVPSVDARFFQGTSIAWKDLFVLLSLGKTPAWDENAGARYGSISAAMTRS